MVPARGVRTRETNQGNLVTDGYVFLVERDRADYNLDRWRTRDRCSEWWWHARRRGHPLPDSDVSEAKTFDILPFPNNLVIIDHQFTPAEIHDAILENCRFCGRRCIGPASCKCPVSSLPAIPDPSGRRPRRCRLNCRDGTPLIVGG